MGAHKAVLNAIEFTGFWIAAAIGAIADAAGLSWAVATMACWRNDVGPCLV